MALTTDLKAYWKLDETSGTTADDSVASHDGTYVNTPTLGATGKIGTAVTFVDANDEKVTIVNHADFRQTSAFSYGGWLKTSDTSTFAMFVSSVNRTVSQAAGTALVANVWTAGKASFQIGSVDGGSTEVHIESATTINDGEWHHIIVTYDGTSGRIYVDGDLDTGPTTMAAPAYNASNYVGMSTWVINALDNYNIDGTFDEVGYWARELTSAEVTSLYNSGDGFAYPFTVAANKTVEPATQTLSLSGETSKAIVLDSPLSLSTSLTALAPTIVIDATHTPSVLALSLAGLFPPKIFEVSALSLNLMFHTPQVDIKDNTNRNPNYGTKSTKIISNLDIPDGIGGVMNLLPETSHVLSKCRVGLGM